MKRVKLMVLAVGLSTALLAGCLHEELSPPPSPGGVSTPPGSNRILFFDDFQGEANTAWRSEASSEGRWVVRNDRYTIDPSSPRDIPMRSFVGNSSWQDYTLEMDVFRGDYHGNQNAVFLRVNNDDMVGFFIAYNRWNDRSEFRVKHDGIWETPGQAWTGGPGSENYHLMITVKDNTYTVYVNDNRWSQVEIEGFESGYIGLQTADWGNDGLLTSFDNVKVTRR